MAAAACDCATLRVWSPTICRLATVAELGYPSPRLEPRSRRKCAAVAKLERHASARKVCVRERQVESSGLAEIEASEA